MYNDIVKSHCSAFYIRAPPSTDCIDRDIVVERLLQRSFGICGLALAWIRSFLHGRCQQIRCRPSQLDLLFRVPPGSVFRLMCAQLSCWKSSHVGP